jgi:DNA (cytosine-5)-methyltransferase 1
MSDLKVVSLFAGIGGIDRGLELAGASTALLCELDPHARKILARHYPHAAIHNDVTELTADDCRAAGAVPGRTVLTAGWPCQGNSVAGARGGMDDPRSGLWSHVVRLLAEHRPAWFIGENVPGLLSVNDGRDFSIVIHDLARLGYGFCWRVLDARHFGVPQRRRRVVIVGRLGDTGAAAAQVLLEPEGVPGNPAAGIDPRPVAAGHARAGTHGSRVVYVADRTTSLKSAPGGADDNFAQGGHLVAFAENQRGELATGSTFAALSTGGGKPGQGYPALTDGVIVRTLSPLERERLQGFPDGWTAGQSDVRRFTQLGNSVAVPVFEWVGRRLVAVDAHLEAP